MKTTTKGLLLGLPTTTTTTNNKKKKKQKSDHYYHNLEHFIQKDSNYLLNLCLKYNWNVVQQCCDVIIRIIISSITPPPPTTTTTPTSSTSTNATRSILLQKAAIQQLLAKDSKGNTPLHAACYHMPPLSVIRSILTAAGTAAAAATTTSATTGHHHYHYHHYDPLQFQLHLMVNLQNATPLCIASKCRAPLRVLIELVHPNNNKDINNNDNGHSSASSSSLPLVLIQDGGSIVSISDSSNGYNPFLGLVSRYKFYKYLPNLKQYYIPIEDITIRKQNIATTTRTIGQQQYHEKDIPIIMDQTPSANTVVVKSKSKSMTSPPLCWSHYPSSDLDKQCYGLKDGSITLFSTIWETINVLFQAAWDSNTNHTLRTQSLRRLLEENEKKEQEEKESSTILFSSSSSSQQPQHHHDHVVYTAAYVSDCLPIKLTDFILRIYDDDDSKQPNQSELTTTSSSHKNKNNDKEEEMEKKMGEEEQQRLLLHPLHFAITTNQIQSLPNSGIPIRQLYQRKYFIDQLLDYDPIAAYQSIPVLLGTTEPGTITTTTTTITRSPLCQAIVSGLQWHIPKWDELEKELVNESCSNSMMMMTSPVTTTTTTSRSDDSSSTTTTKNNQNDILSKAEHGPLQSVWNSAPDALYTRDPSTGLYPFMLAASIDYSSNQQQQPTTTTTIDNDDDDDTYQLDTIYNLLLLYPQCLQGGGGGGV